MKQVLRHTASLNPLSALRKKAQSVEGDSFAEALVAILIAALAAALLATMVTVSANVTMTNETRLSALHAAESTLAIPARVNPPVPITAKTLTATITCASFTGLSSSISEAVTVYSSDNFTRYEPQAATSG